MKHNGLTTGAARLVHRIETLATKMPCIIEILGHSER